MSKEMSTPAVSKPVKKLSDLDPDGFYTYSDYLLWKFKERVELIRGRLFKMSPAPGTAHQKISRELSRFFLNFFHKKPCQVFIAPFDVRLPVYSKKGEDSTVVQPDLCVICDEKKLDEKGCNGAPDLMVEILSPGNTHKEMREKFDAYQEAGVREYWMVDPTLKVVLIYALDKKGIFIGLAPVTEEVPLRSRIFPELEIDLKEIFQ